MSLPGYLTPEYEALRTKYSYLQESISVSSVLTTAFSNKLITDRENTECSNVSADDWQQAKKFLDIMMRKVSASKDNFYTFVQILQQTEQSEIASELEGSNRIFLTVYNYFSGITASINLVLFMNFMH